MIVTETQRLTWQRDVLNEARRLLVNLRRDVGHGQAIEINNIIAQIDSAMVIAWELIGKGEKKDAHTGTN
ncbi:MAG: hypothetical protein EBR82_48360 [Caulobacteraceae bacterium]|nr:hypothetical protein [Caulobacteraceae bacterium]